MIYIPKSYAPLTVFHLPSRRQCVLSGHPSLFYMVVQSYLSLGSTSATGPPISHVYNAPTSDSLRHPSNAPFLHVSTKPRKSADIDFMYGSTGPIGFYRTAVRSRVHLLIRHQVSKSHEYPNTIRNYYLFLGGTCLPSKPEFLSSFFCFQELVRYIR